MDRRELNSVVYMPPLGTSKCSVNYSYSSSEIPFSYHTSFQLRCTLYMFLTDRNMKNITSMYATEVPIGLQCGLL